MNWGDLFTDMYNRSSFVPVGKDMTEQEVKEFLEENKFQISVFKYTSMRDSREGRRQDPHFCVSVPLLTKDNKELCVVIFTTDKKNKGRKFSENNNALHSFLSFEAGKPRFLTQNCFLNCNDIWKYKNIEEFSRDIGNIELVATESEIQEYLPKIFQALHDTPIGTNPRIRNNLKSRYGRYLPEA